MNLVNYPKKEKKQYLPGDIFADDDGEYYILTIDQDDEYKCFSMEDGKNWGSSQEPNIEDAVRGLTFVGSGMKITIGQ